MGVAGVQTCALPISVRCGCLGQRSFDIAAPTPDRIVFRGVDKTVKPVRDARLVFRGRTSGQNAQGTIDLPRVGAGDDSAEPFRCRERNGRLAAGGRPCNKHRLKPPGGRSMTHVATLIAPAGTLTASAVANARAQLSEAGEPRWLAPSTAADISFTASVGLDPRQLAARLRAASPRMD